MIWYSVVSVFATFFSSCVHSFSRIQVKFSLFFFSFSSLGRSPNGHALFVATLSPRNGNREILKKTEWNVFIPFLIGKSHFIY